MRALIMSADNFEDTELLVPYYRLREAGFQVDVAAGAAGSIRGKHGYQVEVTLTFDRVNPADYAVLLLPGGKAPAAIRHDRTVQAIARAMLAAGTPVAAICHGPQILISAGVMAGRSATCYRSVVEELEAAGASYLDREVVVDGKLVTSRQPGDLPAFMRELMRLLER